MHSSTRRIVDILTKTHVDTVLKSSCLFLLSTGLLSIFSKCRLSTGLLSTYNCRLSTELLSISAKCRLSTGQLTVSAKCSLSTGLLSICVDYLQGCFLYMQTIYRAVVYICRLSTGLLSIFVDYLQGCCLQQRKNPLFLVSTKGPAPPKQFWLNNKIVLLFI